MWPVLFRIGGYPVAAYGVFIAAAFLAGIYYLESRRGKIGLSVGQTQEWGLWVVLGSILGAKAFFVALYWKFYSGRLWLVLPEFRYGFVFYGGFLGAILVSALFAKRRKIQFWDLADWAAPAVALGHAIGRLACLASGCCYGRPTHLPWGIRFTDPACLVDERWLGVPLHPTQLYESLGNLLIFLFLHFYSRKPRGRGTIFWIFVLMYSVLRSAIEVFRGDERGSLLLGFAASQMVAFAGGLLALGVLFWKWKKS